jgi:serine/threonine-protein kinase RsbW
MNVMNRTEVKAHLDNLGEIRNFIQASIGTVDLTLDRAGELILAVDETVSNIIMHGFKSTEGNIEVWVFKHPEAILVQILDNAPLFDPTRENDPHLEISPLERDKPGGFGLYLLNHLVDKVSYRVNEDGRNELTFLKKR